MDLDKNPNRQIESPANTLSPEARASISAKLESTWERYIDAIHQFIKLNIYLIVGLAVFVSFLPQLRGTDKVLIESKGLLFGGFLLLTFSFVFEVALRIWVQMFMEYEIMQPPEEVKEYFGDRPHFTWSYRLAKVHYYKWHAATLRSLTAVASLCFLVGLTLSLVFIYQNLK